MGLGISSYPSVKLQDVGTKCAEHGVNAAPLAAIAKYDYIIVGGGTAACVLANRLSNSGSSILLLERGQLSESFKSRAPLLSLGYNRTDAGVLTYESAPQLHLHGKRKMKMISGKLLGGTSRINNGLYSRCQPGEFNDWGEGWQFAKLRGLYERSEQNTSAPPTEGSNGEWKTRIIEPFFETSKIFRETVTGMGVPFVEDFNDPKQPASSITKLRTTVTAQGKRSSTSDAFLSDKEVRVNRNLNICFGAVVQRLHLNDQKRVQGVFVETEMPLPETYYISVEKEVIVCGGAVASPQILLLSGIGPKGQLAKHNITCNVDLPGVGSHLQDHVSVPLCYSVPVESSIHVLQSNILAAVKTSLQYLISGTGMFLSPVAEYTYFLRSDRYPPRPLRESENDSSLTDNLPDLEFGWVGAWGTAEQAPPKVQKSIGFNTLLVQVVQPKSEGAITLVDRDARTPPIVDPNYLGSESDLELFRKGIQYGLDIGQKMMAKDKTMLVSLVPEITSTESLDDFIRRYATGAYHLCSTCRMAAKENDGVVDQNLRVYGVQGLRVADASIFPRLVRVKPQATIVLVAEKCAEMILKGEGVIGTQWERPEPST